MRQRRAAAATCTGGPLGLARLGSLVVLALPLAWPLAAKTLRVASAFDPQSMDTHALALLYQTRVASQVDESLVSRDRNSDGRRTFVRTS